MIEGSEEWNHDMSKIMSRQLLDEEDLVELIKEYGVDISITDWEALWDFYQYIIRQMSILRYELIAEFSLMTTLLILLIVYLMYHRRSAYHGDAKAARKLILPSYIPFLWTILAVCLGFLIYAIYSKATKKKTNLVTNGEAEVYFAGAELVMMSPVIFMYQRSISWRAVIRTSLITLAISCYCIPIGYVLENYTTFGVTNKILLASKAATLFIVLYFWISPPKRASKKYFYAYLVYTTLQFSFFLMYRILVIVNKIKAAFPMVAVQIFLSSLVPILVWKLWRTDTEYWRGLGENAPAFHSGAQEKNNLEEIVSSEGLHVLIEMHRKYIIDFAYLDMKRKIGEGVSAEVYSGLLRSKISVAVKIYTPPILTEEVIGVFSNEAALCGTLKHPNIVQFYGMCVSPPMICLVSELCRCTLEDAILLSRKIQIEHPQRLKELIDLGYMLDASRSIDYLHGFSPSFVHRDIKPSNFLVDFKNVVKLTDFGESRSLPSDWNTHHNSAQPSSSLNDKPKKPCTMTVKGTTDYMAPEMIKGRSGQASYTEAADIYSLGLTLWDILYPGEDKFPSANNNPFKVFELVLNDVRPSFSTSVEPLIEKIITLSWSPNPSQRPTASQVVSILEYVQQSLCLDVSRALNSHLQKDILLENSPELTECPFYGFQLVHGLFELGMITTDVEGERIGNQLMDAGYLHHINHKCAFRNSDQCYFFSKYDIQMGLHRTRLSISKDSLQGSDSMTSTVCSSTMNCSCQQWSRAPHDSNDNNSSMSSTKRRVLYSDNILTSKLLDTERSYDSDDIGFVI